MRIQSSTVSMSSSRKSRTDTERTRVTTDRSADGGSQKTAVTVQEFQSSRLEESASTALFQTSGAGGAVTVQEDQTEQESQTGSAPSEAPVPRQEGGAFQVWQAPENRDWFSSIQDQLNSDPRAQIYRQLLELLDRAVGNKPSGSRSFLNQYAGENRTFQLSASAVSERYRQNLSFFGIQTQSMDLAKEGIVLKPFQPVNGTWIRQVKESGFVHGEEHTQFASAGTAVTADGRTLNFGISVEMSRSFTEAYQITGKTEVYTDPLVINLDTLDASLSDLHFYFDLNGDGEKEEISGLNSASGFLAFDKNGDGKINDGSELFGAKTGDGFRELAQYDQDKNGWIDENDEIFSKLSVWVQCGDGESKLLSLAEANVGAIFLGSQESQFSLADSSGDVGAMARRTGIYLKETGEAGTVQHLDFKT